MSALPVDTEPAAAEGGFTGQRHPAAPPAGLEHLKTVSTPASLSLTLALQDVLKSAGAN